MVGLLKTIGILSIIVSLFCGLVWSNSANGHSEYVIACVIVGIINCIICFALAICVKAAKLYLSEHESSITSASSSKKKGAIPNDYTPGFKFYNQHKK